MNNSTVSINALKPLLVAGTPFIDVRAPLEFSQGSIPGSVNIPILDNTERALVGTTYKHQGHEAAMNLGHQIVSGAVKAERVARWSQYAIQNPVAVVYCFRGGKRSHIAQQWLKEAGIERPVLEGGYKAARRFLINIIEDFSVKHPLVLISGPTGSGKTVLLDKVSDFIPALDLECLAHHRGSAFGALHIPQPTQIDFENRLAVALIRLEHRLAAQTRLLVEDESRHIGRNYLPEAFFTRLRSSAVVWIDEPLDIRVNNIFNDYVLYTAIGSACRDNTLVERVQLDQAMVVFEHYQKALTMISKKLGGLRTREIMADLETSRMALLNRNDIQSNKVWIEKLLTYYYDPLYFKSLERRQVKILFKGSQAAAIEYLKMQCQV